MKAFGKELAVAYGSSKTALKNETSSTLTISRSFVDGAGDTRGSKAHNIKKSWRIDATTFIDESLLVYLITCMQNGTCPVFYFKGTYGLSTINVNGECIITSLSFAGQGKGLVQLNIKLQGKGKPTISLQTESPDVTEQEGDQ